MEGWGREHWTVSDDDGHVVAVCFRGREHWTVSDDDGHVVAVCFTADDANRVRAALEGMPLAPDERDAFWHNAVAHPLLVLCPRVGRWLHDRTEPTVERDRWRRLLGQRVV